MLFRSIVLCVILVVIQGDFLTSENQSRSQATLKPLSACCDIPEIGDQKQLMECSTPRPTGPCADIKCVFEKQNWLTGETLNKEAFKAHLRSWASKHQGWSEAVEKAITDCVDKDLRQYLDVPCKAYDVFSCTGIAMIKNAASQEIPEECWQPPPHVEKPFECCSIPQFFKDEHMNECGFRRRDGNLPLQGIPPQGAQFLGAPSQGYAPQGAASQGASVGGPPPQGVPLRGPSPQGYAPQEAPPKGAPIGGPSPSVYAFQRPRPQGPPLRGPPPHESLHAESIPCYQEQCLMKKNNLTKEDSSFDKEAISRYMDQFSIENPNFANAMEKAKEECLLGKLTRFGAPEMCKDVKLLMCVSTTLLTECPAWSQTDKCIKLKEHLSKCRAFIFPDIN